MIEFVAVVTTLLTFTPLTLAVVSVVVELADFDEDPHAVAAIASQDPGPVSFTRLSARRPVASYLASAAAPFGNGWELFALIALIFSVCVFVAGLLQERRGARRPA